MKISEWFSMRGAVYTRHRARSLLTRYRLSPGIAMKRIDDCVTTLVNQGCNPTFSTPGKVVMRYPKYIRHIQEMGAEIAVHGYQHEDLRAYPVKYGYQQLVKAVESFNRNGINVYGFRCPYLGCTDELLEEIPKGLFQYSSNKAIYWNLLQGINEKPTNTVRDTLRNIYHAVSHINAISVPYSRSNIIEIPVCLPDDLELIDGLNLSVEEVANAWIQIMDHTYQRGELFTLIFHPELAVFCEHPFNEVLHQAKLKVPHVWLARLCDISAWWAEKSSFKVEITPSLSGIRLSFVCSSRATILVKGFDLREAGRNWDGAYQRLWGYSLEMPASPRPFLGLSSKGSPKVKDFLTEQGYILDTTSTASDCGIYLDETILAGLNTQTALINYIEECPGPIVRFWRWPDGAKSALSITGDLDALSLMDYFSRLYNP